MRDARRCVPNPAVLGGTLIHPLHDDCFARGEPVAPTGPRVFYLNLTERCQLRCRHCITKAPKKTVEGSARDMSRNVLEALRPHLRHARYVGLTHAGEPMLSSAFEPLLDILAEEASQPAPVVHLLTNGMAMTESRFLDVARRGVRSLSVSIDGFSSATNDALRVGSRIDLLRQRVFGWVAVRAKHNLDVRLGVAWTVTATNHGEVEDAVRFFAGAGLDWLKLEEVYPLDEVAAAEVPPKDVTRQAVARATRVGREVGLPVLDHTVERAVWKCAAGPEFAPAPDDVRFSVLDDFANRLDINPCRLPWELVCVEPDGVVKPMNFHHPGAGSVLEADLLELFNGPAFQRQRAFSARRRRCGLGPVTCPPVNLDPQLPVEERAGSYLR